MSNIDSLGELKLLDELANGDTVVHRIHPAVKLVVTLAYIVSVVSFGRYELTALLPFVFYPIVVFALAELPVAPILKRALWAAPLIVGIGIWNPVFDHSVCSVFGFAFSGGWITFANILIKGGLTVTASLLLIATTGMNRLGAALRTVGTPKILVLQLLLTYRYLSVLTGESARMTRAYALRAPRRKEIAMGDLGSFVGHLALRTYDRAQRIYDSMMLRGFTGEYRTGAAPRPNRLDLAYFAVWSAFFVAAVLYDLPTLLGSLFTGGITR